MNSDLSSLIDQCTSEVNDIEERISKLGLDKSINYLTKYTLIKTCGTLEYVYRSIVADAVSEGSNEQVQTFIDNKVRSGSMSPTYDNMSKLLKSFDLEWCDSFKNEVNQRSDKNRLLTASKSIVENRHLFAHGKEPTASFLDIKQYYFDVLELIYILDEIVNNAEN